MDDEGDEIAVAPTRGFNDVPPSDDPLQEGATPQPSKPTRLTRSRENYEPPSGNTEELKNDLSDFGFGTQKVKQLLNTREFYFDATMQRPQYQTRQDRENERKGIANASARSRRTQPAPARDGGPERTSKRVKGEKTEGVAIEGTGNWVLFDPQAHNFPIYPCGDTPASFQRYMQYEPGNTRIVEINLETASVRLKSTPDALEGKAVHYTEAGPKLVDVVLEQPTAPKRRPGRPNRRGGRGGPVQIQERKESLGSSILSGVGSLIKKEKRTVVKAEPLSDGGSESDSPLSDFEEVMEIGDSQE